MNKKIILDISSKLKIRDNQVLATLNLLEEGNTIPFIARYRKEATGNLDEEQIREISEVYVYEQNLFKRKEDIIRLIDEKGMMNDELRQSILNSTKLVEVEDLYRPYKEKKKTKATEAIKFGLEPLANLILELGDAASSEAKKYINENILTDEEAIINAKYIIAEKISDNSEYRKWIRSFVYNNGKINSKLKKNKEDETKVYEMYYDYQFDVKYEKPHRILAMNRGEKEDILAISITTFDDNIINYLNLNFNKKDSKLIEEAIVDSYKRLIFPSIEREIRSELTDTAEQTAIQNFSHNLEKLLLQPPMKEKKILALDPAFRTGCKLAVLDKTGNMVDIDVIYPHEPQNDVVKSREKLINLIDKYDVDLIAIGNGTASRESELFIANLIRETKKIPYVIVSEAGASVYSASKLAIEEFPDLSVEQRSAISIGRRIQDPLSELVKIDPESIGVGLYQHDVTTKKLKESLDFTVEKVVNQVGVNVNLASPSLLKHVSGLSKKNIDKIIDYRVKKGKISSREELKKILSDKTYEQSIGFLRILFSKNLLDATSIHPESYKIALSILEMFELRIEDIGKDNLIEKLNTINVEELSSKLGIDKYTLGDILNDLKKPNRDPRDSMPQPLLRQDILTIEDLKIGMLLQGTVRNVVDFGAFIDIGLKNDGLAHISKLTNHFIKHPNEVVNIGDIVDVYVDDINMIKKKVSLSLIKPQNN
jgi:uncharacterized protein